ncbi:MAG: hypothetical protein AAGJ52_04800, partial [Pseudomonadota bacterium]
DERMVPQVDDISGLKRGWTFDPLMIDEGAVGAVQVGNAQNAILHFEAGMLARNTFKVELQLTATAAPYGAGHVPQRKSVAPGFGMLTRFKIKMQIRHSTQKCKDRHKSIQKRCQFNGYRQMP